MCARGGAVHFSVRTPNVFNRAARDSWWWFASWYTQRDDSWRTPSPLVIRLGHISQWPLLFLSSFFYGSYKMFHPKWLQLAHAKRTPRASPAATLQLRTNCWVRCTLQCRGDQKLCLRDLCARRSTRNGVCRARSFHARSRRDIFV